jgi:hypothetical protein
VQVADDLLERLSEVPQPIALALGRVVRASGLPAQLEATLKAAEVTARYLAVLGLASAAALRAADEDPLAIEGFSGDLSFGSFEAAARASYNTSWSHPLRNTLRQCLRSARKRKAVGGECLVRLVQLRNELGHALTHLDEPRARAISVTRSPITALAELLDGIQPILQLPLLAVLNQQHRWGQVRARVAYYTGEGEPFPQDLVLADGIYEWECPYLCTDSGLLPLSPGLALFPQADGRFGLYIVDAINESGVRYKSVYDSSVLTDEDSLPHIAQWVQVPFPVMWPDDIHRRPSLETVRVSDGRSLYAFLSHEPIDSQVGNETESEVRRADTALSRDTSQPSETAALTTQTVEAFEERANAAGLGSIYRDVLYCMYAHEARAEAAERTIRVVTTTETHRVLLLFAFRGPHLAVTYFPGAFAAQGEGTSAEEEQSEPVGSRTVVFAPSDTADRFVDELERLFEHRDSAESRN